MIARADNRGLGVQSWEFHRHMKPEATLVIDMGRLSPYANFPERYAGSEVRVAPFDGDRLEDADMQWLLERSDVIYTAETPYDYRLLDLARERGVRTVIQPNHEFFRWNREPDLPRPDLFIAPSLWHYDEWPEPKIYLPFPVARDRLPYRPRTEARRFLHVRGHPAMQDRNGTRLLMQALPYVRRPIELTVTTQARMGSMHNRARPRNVRMMIDSRDVPNYWSLYDGFDVLVLPRRFGGQSLPMNEALSAGMPVLMLDTPPQSRILPAKCLIPARNARPIACQPGFVDCCDADPHAVAERIDALAGDPALVASMSAWADAYAESISWDRLGPRYRSLLEFSAPLEHDYQAILDAPWPA